jgi:hypothetical protein
VRPSLWLPVLALPLALLAQPAAAQNVTGPPTDLTTGSITTEIAPRLSFDGTKLTYTATNGPHDLSYTSNNVWVMTNAGANRTELVVHAYFGGTDEWSSLSPDGSKAVLHCTEYSGGSDPVSKVSLYIIDIANSIATRITNTPTESANDAFPTWSSDGKYIVFVSDRATGDYQLFAMKPEVESATNVPFQLTNWTDSTVSRARCTPDGKVLYMRAYKTDAGGGFDIYRSDLTAGSTPVAITHYGPTGKYISDPSMAAAGGKIFVTMGAKDGRIHVFLMNADGTGIHQVTGGQFAEDYACAANDKLVVTYFDAAANGVDNGDVGIYSLSAATATGTVSGKLTTSLGAPQAGATVNVYDGDTLVTSGTTTAAGAYTFTLAPGGYTLEFVTASPASYTVTRSVAVPSGGAVTQDAFTTPTGAPRPVGAIATIKGTSVYVRFRAGNVPSSPYTVSGYNIYRGASETGPWTKINASLVPATAPLQYIDAAPGDLSKAFYTVTTVTAGGGALESAYADVTQAANNLVFNPSFEQVDGSGNPIGWEFVNWGSGTVGGTSTVEKTDGTKSAVVDPGNALGMYHTTVDYQIPNPMTAIVEGAWAYAKDYSGGGGFQVREAPNAGSVFEWYADTGYTDYDTPAILNADGPMPWTWVSRNDNVVPWEFTQKTRFTMFNNGGGTVTGLLPVAYFDEATYQVRRFTTTGMVWGRVIDINGRYVSGATVTVGGKSVTTLGAPFVVRDVPTGPQTLTIKVPGQPDFVKQINNYGGYALEQDYQLPIAFFLNISGTVRYPDGTVCAGADVRLDANDGTELAKKTTDANGKYSFGDVNNDVSFAGVSWITAHKAGFVSVHTSDDYGLSGQVVRDLTLDMPAKYIQVSKVTGTAPVIDGTVNLATEYAGAQYTPFDLYDPSVVTSPLKVGAYTKWDDGNLYIAYVSEEPSPASMLAAATGRDNGTIWWTGSSWNADDLFAVWLDPNNGSRTGIGYEQWQILMNSNTSDPSLADIAWRNATDLWGLGENVTGLEWKSRVDSAAKMWYLEARIPFSDLGVTGGMAAPTVAVGTEWVIDLARHRHLPLPDGNDYDSGWSILHFVNTVTTVKGDINGDGLVNNYDALASLRIAAGLERVGTRLSAADVNGDGKADLSDTVKIVRKIRGTDTAL